MNEREKAKAFLLRAADIVEKGWCKKVCAQSIDQQPVVCSAPNPAHPQPKEKPYIPVYFDVGSAIFRAASRPSKPRGKKKEDVKLLYQSVWPEDRDAYQLALTVICRLVKTNHLSLWNDRFCESSEHAAETLRA
jgi:hypothetical protein